jgi:hypothetical protein
MQHHLFIPFKNPNKIIFTRTGTLTLNLRNCKIPSGLIIFNLPNKIHLWISSILQKLPNPQQSHQVHQKSTNDLYQDGSPSSAQLGYNMISTSTTFQSPKDTNYSVPLWKLSIPKNLINDKTIDLHLSRPNLVLPPWDTWHRPSRLLTDKTLGAREMENLRSFYTAK